MARLRVRLELNRRSAGVPLDKLASVVEETRKFFHLLAEDVRIEVERGEWMASDFDTESLNFTAEFSGPATTEQVRAFSAAFAGATSLRRATIAQFTRIADFLGEDELVGFGLFQSDIETEPSEWRCLSKRDAQRFGQEIHMLAEAAGESQTAGAALPAVMNGSVAGRRLFKDRRERDALTAGDPAKLIREVESNLSRRIGLLEGEVAAQTRKMKELREIGPAPDAADERFKKLLSAMEKFWAQAPRQMQLLAAPATPEAPAAPAVPESVAATAVAEPEPAAASPSVEPAESEPAKYEAAKCEPAKPEPAPAPVEVPTPEPLPAFAKEVPAKKSTSKRWWVMGVAAAMAVALSFAIPQLRHAWSQYTAVETMPVTRPNGPAAPAPPAVKVGDVQPEGGKPIQAKPVKQAIVKQKAAKSPLRFEGPQIALEIPADVRAKVPAEARVEVIVAIDEQGNVTRAEVASTKGAGARLLAKEALAAARRSRFRPAREGERAVQSQMVLTYFVKPDSAEF